MSWTQEKLQTTVNELTAQAASNISLRESIKANPKAAIEKIANLQVPAGFTIHVADLNDAELTIVLPKMKSDELSDNDLEAVAGGKWTDDVVNAVGGAVCAIGDAGKPMVDGIASIPCVVPVGSAIGKVEDDAINSVLG